MHECPEGCGRSYQSIRAAMLCQCEHYDTNGYPKQQPAYDI